MIPAVYPHSPAERTRWILERRPARNEVTADRAGAFFSEEELQADGSVARVAAVLLTNRECPWKCLMCDLWRNTTTAPVPRGAVPRQIRDALGSLRPASVLKLYNSGSFFDSGAIPRSDWPEIARLVEGFERVILECHPRLAGPAAVEFARMIQPRLEVAMGLETCHPEALSALNKRISVEDYRRAAQFLKRNSIAVRTFLLVHPPFIPSEKQREWLEQSVLCALEAGSDVVSLIPTRAGNGALDELMRRGAFNEPALDDLEFAFDRALSLRKAAPSPPAFQPGGNAARIFADTWDLQRFSKCNNCFERRCARLTRMNLTQVIEPRVDCSACTPGP